MSEIGFTFQLEFWHWLILARILAGIEILTPGFFFLWLGGAALITGIIALVVPALGWENAGPGLCGAERRFGAGLV